MHRSIVAIILAVAALGLPGPADADGGGRGRNGGGTPGTSSNFELVGHEPLFGRGIKVSDPSRPRVVSEYLLPENACPAESQAQQERGSYTAHNPTLSRKLALVSWHSGGLQAIDIASPVHLRQRGWFSPTPLLAVANEDPALSGGTNKVVMWSFPIISDGLIYVIDIRNGLYILRYTGRRAHEVNELDFLEGNSNLGDARRLNRWSDS